jgi:hypothetical protein
VQKENYGNTPCVNRVYSLELLKLHMVVLNLWAGSSKVLVLINIIAKKIMQKCVLHTINFYLFFWGEGRYVVLCPYTR